MSQDLLREDLRQEIAAGRVLAIVGAGVSIGATRNAPVASWTGLLKDGVERCVAVVQSLSANWKDRPLADLESGDLDDLLATAGKVAAKLGAPDGPEYRRWLRETVGALRAQDRAVLEHLRDLGVPIATTNYDGLLEEVTGRPWVTWRQGAKVERALRDEPAILHLHGHWDEPESVVLDLRSYERVVGDVHAQTVLRALRTMKTLLYVGCGEGLADPNFGAFLGWARKVLSEGEPRHFRLCREGELGNVQAQHPPADRIFALSYGASHGDLAPFLRSLAPSARPGSGRATAPSPSTPPGAPRLPAAPRCFGRDDEVRDLVGSLCADPPPPTPILGPAGAGKSTIALKALHDPSVIARFGPRRFFVRCDGAKGREALAAETARSLRIEPGPQIEPALFVELARAPIALVLDNLETPWEAETAAVEAFLAELCGVPGLALVASIRGEQRPFGVPWREAIHAGPLGAEAARSAFLAVAGARFAADPQLDTLLEAVDRLALAVTLLAYRAEAEPDLASVARQWQKRRTEMLHADDGDQPSTNLEVSLELSIGSPRVTDPARKLLSILALLPDGVAHQDLLAILPGDAEEAAAVLRRVGLAFDSAGRLRALAPVREHVHRSHPPEAEDRQRTIEHYLDLAKLGEQVGTQDGAAAVERLAPEVANLEAMTLAGLETEEPRDAIAASMALARLARYTGLLAAAALREPAIRAATRLQEPALAAACLDRFGGLMLDRCAHDVAHVLYQQALLLYRSVCNVLGEANCYKGLGNIARHRSEHEAARDLYQQALPLYRRVGDVRGEANCIWRLGDVAFSRSEHDTAYNLYQQALKLYRSIGNVLGEANCFKGFGDIALRRSKYSTASDLYQQARQLFRRVGDVLCEANCIQNLGDIALHGSEHDAARDLYQQALPTYRRAGYVLGEADCIQGFGDLELATGERAEAEARFAKALELYRRIPEPYSIGWALVRLARLAAGGRRRRLVQEARASWESIDRPDLVAKLRAEFGDLAQPAGPPPDSSPRDPKRSPRPGSSLRSE